MKQDRPSPLSAPALLIGVILVALGGWGMYYSGLKSAEEKEKAWAATEQELRGEIAALKQSAGATPASSPSAAPSESPVAVHSATPAPEHKQTPALITSDSGSAAPGATTAPEKITLNDKQRQALVDSLRKHTGKSITICSPQSDAGALKFAGTLKHIFEEAGWRVEGVKQLTFAKPPEGLNLAAGSYPSPDGLIAAYQAFSSAGLPVSQQLDTKLSGSQVELIVGAAGKE